MSYVNPVFVSHGSPMTALEPREAGAFFSAYGRWLQAPERRPSAILAISAHTLAPDLLALDASEHVAVHDFQGFTPALYQLQYDTLGAPYLVERLEQLLRRPIPRATLGRLDHGIWTVLRYMFPDAEIPVLPLAWSPRMSPAELFSLGQQIAPLSAEGVLVLATGSITHNLSLVFQGQPSVDAPERPESAAFRAWFQQQAQDKNWPALMAYRTTAPHARMMHPSDEHLLPWFVAAGAGGEKTPAVRIHESLTYGCLGMDAYTFGPGAETFLASATDTPPPSR